jgi:hypothetical protein
MKVKTNVKAGLQINQQSNQQGFAGEEFDQSNYQNVIVI